MIGSNLSYIFAVRCLFHSKPVLLLSIPFISISVVLAYMLKVIEGPTYVIPINKANYNNYSLYENCLWTIFITMTTGICLNI
jgi:hypothetical protein